MTGNGATIAALQFISAGDPRGTMSRPSEVVARAAVVAVELLNGETPEAATTLLGTPSRPFVPVVIRRDNVEAEIVDARITSAPDVRAADHPEARAALGIQ